MPSNLNIDQTRPLSNTVPTYTVHLVLLTGKTDWPAHIEDDEGVAQALIEAIHERKGSLHRAPEAAFHVAQPQEKEALEEADAAKENHTGKAPAVHGNKKKEPFRVLVTCAALASPFSRQRGSLDVLLLPDNVVIANVTRRRAGPLVDFCFGRGTSHFNVHPSPYRTLIMVCGHGRKDRRCGTVGPMLQTALTDAIKQGRSACWEQGQEDGALDDTAVTLVSHLGGHAFAGNMVIYTHQGHRAIWYGRVTPCHCVDVVQQTLRQNRVLLDLVRGIFEAGSPQPCGNTVVNKTLLDW